LNPLRAKVVATLHELDRYPWCGHATLMGLREQGWQDERAVLSRFGKTRAEARRTYRHYVAEGVPQGRRPELVGGGLLRSRGIGDVVEFVNFHWSARWCRASSTRTGLPRWPSWMMKGPSSPALSMPAKPRFPTTW